MSSISFIQARLKLGLDTTAYNQDEIKYMMTPIGKAIYQDALTNEKKILIENNTKISDEKQFDYINESDIKRAKWNPVQKIKCQTCGELFSRANRSRHSKTKVHMAYSGMNDKIKKILINM
jgi:formylmethanofuran dehydrogenase subunit E